MKRLICLGVIICIVLVIVFAGCSGGNRTFNYYLYVANYTDKNISMFQINNNNGKLASVGTLPLPSPANYPPIAIKAHYSGKYLYLACENSYDIFIYNIKSDTGELTLKKSFLTSSAR